MIKYEIKDAYNYAYMIIDCQKEIKSIFKCLKRHDDKHNIILENAKPDNDDIQGIRIDYMNNYNPFYCKYVTQNQFINLLLDDKLELISY